MGVPPLRFRPALSRSIIVLSPPSSPCRLQTCIGGSCLSLALKTVMAHGLPARVGKNVSDEWLWNCQGTLRGTIPLHLSRWKPCFVRVFLERFLIFIDIPQKSHWEISNYYISFMLFLFPQVYLLILPYSNVVPAPESHRSVASLLSSQSRIPFSGRYSLVKLHGFTPPIFTPQFRAKQKHRKMPTTQAEFLLSEGKPLTVLGQSQW